MATYSSIGDTSTMNDAQKNDAARNAGYTGWSDYLDNANKERQGGGGTNSSIGSTPASSVGGGAITFAQPTLDLNSLYSNLTKESGIGTLQSQISDQEKAYNTAMTKINDNPFLAEGNRVGRGQKLTQDYTAAGANLRKDLATKQADIETRLNIATKQFDINSKQAADAFNQFQSLLSTGALDNATADDIANITRATGISSGMVQSAINAAKQAKVQDVKTEMIKYDDGTNQGYLIVNSKTGEIIKKDTIAASEPKKGTGGGSTATQTKANEQADVQYLLELYKNTNKNNPSWQKAHDLRSQYSPADFKAMLLQTYPTQATYIKNNLK